MAVRNPYGSLGVHPLVAARINRSLGIGAQGQPRAQLFQDALNNEGIYASQRAGLAAEDAAARSGMQGAIDALRFQYDDPSNPYSFLTQLSRQANSARANMVANRAARGVLQSGGTALQEADLGYRRGLQEYEGANQLMQGIGGLQADYAAGQRERMLQQQGYLGDAQQRLIAGGLMPPGPAPVTPGVARPVIPPTIRPVTPRLRRGGGGATRFM